MLASDKPKKSFAAGENGHFLLEISHIGAVLGACVILDLRTRPKWARNRSPGLG